MKSRAKSLGVLALIAFDFWLARPTGGEMRVERPILFTVVLFIVLGRITRPKPAAQRRRQSDRQTRTGRDRAGDTRYL